MKKKILFVIHGLYCGGAEKSLISLLEALPKQLYDIDLLIGKPNGVLLSKVPSDVNILSDCYEFENYSTPISERRKKIAGILDFLLQIKWQIQKRIDKSSEYLAHGEYKWKIWGKYLPKLHGKYDLAISYMNGFPNYYVIEKVCASHKVLWVHNEFEKLGYNKEFEEKYFDKADSIVTISDLCAQNIIKFYPKYGNKIRVLENITSGDVVRRLATEKIDDEYFRFNGYKLLSIGRLNEQKNFDLAIEVACLLKQEGVDFLWYILGEGEQRKQLTQKIIDNKLGNNVVLAGIRSNPYPYIDKCDVFIQTSLYEGKSIALDEAKILQKPIVITNYATSSNSIKNGSNGLIVDFDPKSVLDGIKLVLSDSDIQNKFRDNLVHDVDGNIAELDKYLELINSFIY